MEDALHPLPEADKLAESHLDSEVAVDLWASYAQGGRPSETVLKLIFVFPGVSHCVCMCVLFVHFVLSYKVFFES